MVALRRWLAPLVLGALVAACGDNTTVGQHDGGSPPPLAPGARLALREGWQIQTSTGQPGGAAVSKPGFAAAGWYPTTAPATVAGVLAQNEVYPDPFVGMNLRDEWPGIGYPVGEEFSIYEMPEDSPFRVGWWFRTEFDLPAELAGASLELHLEGINYRADVWLNGEQLADSTEIVGSMRRWALDITRAARPGARNALALAVQAPHVEELGLNWVDWAPFPPDKMTGLWREAYITTSGTLRLRDPFVRTLVAADLASADLVVSVDVENTGATDASGAVSVTLEGTTTTMPVSVPAGATERVTLAAADHPALHLASPRLWWPAGYGTPELYDLEVRATVGDDASDSRTVRFGVREATSQLTADGYRQYFVNGRPILVRGAGWARNLFFMETPEREEQEIRLVLDMGLNAVRFEGKMGSDHLLDLADEGGLLIIPGFCCCDWWEQWWYWNDETRDLAVASFRDQLILLRNRPSVLAFWYGSDLSATPEVEERYLAVAAETGWPNPLVASAGEAVTTVGSSGHKMRGPYDYEPPSYWYLDRGSGGAWGFATEIGTGKAIPSVEHLRRMLGDDHLWPQDEAWIWHSQGNAYATFAHFDGALSGRYGAPADLADYVKKAQLISYDNERAMFEAYGRNKYQATGVIKWMLNDAWPGLAWHLYDYYLAAGGGYYGTKKSLEPVHVQYSHDDRAIVVVSSTLAGASGITVRARVLDLAAAERWSQTAVVDVPPDGVVPALTVPDLGGLSTTYFLWLQAEDPTGTIVSRNFYWLSTVEDVLDWDHTEWYYTPTLVHGDFTALATLPPVALTVDTAFDQAGDDDRAVVTLTNPGTTLAFFVHLRVLEGAGGGEVLPQLWDDNYVSLLPGETRTLTARWRPADAHGATPVVAVDGWNVQ
jgi:exo-1,4-beta-D-glucosaminidase